MAKPQVRFIECVIPVHALPMDDLARIAKAVAVLQKAGENGLIAYSEEVRRAPSTSRSDTKPEEERALQPQSLQVYRRLSMEPLGMTMPALRDDLGIPEGSANGQLNLLRRRGLVEVRTGRPQRWIVPGRSIPTEC